jgi:hypothetical protein
MRRPLGNASAEHSSDKLATDRRAITGHAHNGTDR